MSSSKKNDVISIAPPHSIKKFELISEYVKAWVQILMLNSKCKGIVYIDCMSNSGLYKNEDGEEIKGTPLLVSEIIADAMHAYPQKQAYLYFNDLSEKRIELLNTRLPKLTSNFHIYTEVMDANKLLRIISKQFSDMFKDMHFLLIYDPYDAHIELDAITPFLRNWGEIIINHMVSDTVRAVRTAKRPDTINKYEETYQMSINELIDIGSDRDLFEKQIEKIILEGSGRNDGKYYIASFPFFIRTNTVVYNLIHCTGHKKGFELFKSTAWKSFGDKSSMKNTHNKEKQMQFKINENGEFVCEIPSDESCYNIRDIAMYAQKHFAGRNEVPNDEVWEYIGAHPIFPTLNYKNKIKDALKSDFDLKSSRSTMTFSDIS